MSWNGGKETKYLGVDPNVGMIFQWIKILIRMRYYLWEAYEI